MNLINVIKLLSSLLAAYFAGYVPVYFLLEYKKRKKRIFRDEQKDGYSLSSTKKDGRDGRETSSEDRFQINRMPNSSALNYEAGFPGRHDISRQIFIFFVSIYLGFYIISNYLILLSLLKINFGFLNAALFGLVFFVAFVFIQIFKAKRAKYPGVKLQHYITGNNKAKKGSGYRSETGANSDFKCAGNSTGLKQPPEFSGNMAFPKNITGNSTEYGKNQKGDGSDHKECKGNPKEDKGNLSERAKQKEDENYLSEHSKQEEKSQKKQTVKISKVSIAFQLVFAFLIFINFCVVSFFTFLFPIRFWDAISCWSLKGRAFFLDGNVTAFYTQHQYTFTHLTYPLYISLSQTWIYIWLGEINETLVKAIFPLFYLSLVFIVYYLLRKEVKRLYAIISVFILSTLPVIMDHGYLEYTNLIFSVILLLGVYYFYVYVLKSRENLPAQNQAFQNHTAQNQVFQNHTAQNQAFQNHTVQNQAFQNHTVQNQSNQNHCSQTLPTQSPDIMVQEVTARRNTQDNLKNLIISAVFFAILISIRSEGILFIAIFLMINTAYNFSALPGRLQDKNICPAKDIKPIKSSKRINIILKTLFSMLLPAALILLLLAPWTILQAKLNISGASTEWVPVIEGLKNGLNSIISGSLPGGLKESFSAGSAGSLFKSGGLENSLKNFFNGTVAGGQSEISGLFDFKNALGAFLGEFLFSKFDSARAFLGSSYGISWIVLAVLAVFNLKKLFKAFNWIFFVFLTAGFIALFVSLGFIAEFAWSTERYMLHLFPLAYFWVMRAYLSNTISPRSLAPEK